MTKPYPITVREATAKDARAISELSTKVFIQTFAEEFALPYFEADLAAFLPGSHGAAKMAQWIADPAAGVWVAEAGPDLAGYALTGPMSLPAPGAKPGDVELHRLYVRREHQGGRAARALMDTAMAWLEARGGDIYVGVWSGNIRAQRFYARYGFVKVGEYDYPVGQVIDREFILKRQ